MRVSSMKVCNSRVSLSSLSTENLGLRQCWMALYFLKPNEQSPPCILIKLVMILFIICCCCLPCFSFHVLFMTVHHLSLPRSFKCGSDWLQVENPFYSCHTYFLCWLCLISSGNNLSSQTPLGMLPQVTSRFHITCVQISLNTSCFLCTTFCSTLKDMTMLAVNILNHWLWPEGMHTWRLSNLWTVVLLLPVSVKYHCLRWCRLTYLCILTLLVFDLNWTCSIVMVSVHIMIFSTIVFAFAISRLHDMVAVQVKHTTHLHRLIIIEITDRCLPWRLMLGWVQRWLWALGLLCCANSCSFLRCCFGLCSCHFVWGRGSHGYGGRMRGQLKSYLMYLYDSKLLWLSS